MEKHLQNIYPTYYNLLIAEDLWQVFYQILLIIFLKEFVKLNVNTDTMIRNVKPVELNVSIATVFLNVQILRNDLIECNCLFCNQNYQQKFDEKLKEGFFNT